MLTDPKAYPPFFCAECWGEELPPGADHAILPGGEILCRECFAEYDGPVQILAPNRAAAVAALTARGQMTPATTKKKEHRS